MCSAWGPSIMAFGIFAAVRRGALSSRRLLDLGLVFQVVGALGIAVREFWQGLPPTAGSSFLVPGECVWLVAYPLLVPNTPRKILVASLSRHLWSGGTRDIRSRNWHACRSAARRSHLLPHVELPLRGPIDRGLRALARAQDLTLGQLLRRILSREAACSYQKLKVRLATIEVAGHSE